MTDKKTQIARLLERLIGLPLAIARDAGNMKNFQFGAVRPHPSGRGAVGQYALHIQCPWRLVGSEGIVTGSTDYYEPAEEDQEVDLKDVQAGNRQRKHLTGLLGGYDSNTRSLVNNSDRFVVEGVLVDDCNGLDLTLSGGFHLQIFPCGSIGEDWRFFAPGTDDDHVVVDAGRLSEPEPR